MTDSAFKDIDQFVLDALRSGGNPPRPVTVIIKDVFDMTGVRIPRNSIDDCLERLRLRSRAGYVNDEGFGTRWIAVPSIEELADPVHADGCDPIWCQVHGAER